MGDLAARLKPAEDGVTREEPPAVDRGKASVLQPDQVMKDRGRLVRRVGIPEVIPARVEELRVEIRPADRVGLFPGGEIPRVGLCQCARQ